VFVDLDRFKPVNDTLGHAAGDEVLELAAQRMQSAVRDHDLIGRIGGDEFLVICPNVPHAVEALAVADRIALAITTLAEVGPGTVELRASVGVAFSSGGLDADALIAHADTAMYEAKRAGAERATLFTGAAALC
jgi:diguanylate cyclase (GGDEF)-like protein